MFNFARWRALFAKEFRQISRNKRLIVMLVIPPTLNIVLLGFALDSTVTNLKLGVVDESRSAESRELISAMTESNSFQVSKYYLSSKELGDDLSAGRIAAGLVIPFDFAKKRARRETAEVQLLIDAVDSNTATIAGGYASRIIAALNQRLLREQPPRVSQPTIQMSSPGATTDSAFAENTPISMDTAQPKPKQSVVTPHLALLYNPGLENSWFIVTGMIGSLLVLQGTIVAAGAMVGEKEAGTVEQLLMTPAEAGEIITAKIAPIFLLMTGDIALALVVARLVFDIPVRGSLLLFFVTGALCVLSGIGIGTLIATFVQSQQQAQLVSFFVNPPIVLLSGATTPIEAMPAWLQPVTWLSPVRHFSIIARGILLKGSDLDVLYPNVLTLVGFCILLVGISSWRFRRQLR